jgi:hypothetical protein
MRNKPPLLSVAIALFGNESYVATHSQNPSAYDLISEHYRNVKDGDDMRSGYGDNYYASKCRELNPIAGLFDNKHGIGEEGCITRSMRNSVPYEIKNWLQHFWDGVGVYADDDAPRAEERMHRGFNAAVFLANHVWLSKSRPQGGYGTLTVNYDLGADRMIPSISLAGIITISVLFGAFLIGLGAMAVYASHVPRWTPTLDAFAMIRVGASMSEDISLLSGDEAKRDILNRVPAWFGDLEPHTGEGTLGLGVQEHLMRRRENHGS